MPRLRTTLCRATTTSSERQRAGTGRGGALRLGSPPPARHCPHSQEALGSLIPTPAPCNLHAAPPPTRFDAYNVPDEFVVRYGSPCGNQVWDSEPRGFSYLGCAATSPCCCGDLYGGTPACAFQNCRSGTIFACPAGAGAGTSPLFAIPPPPVGSGATTTTVYVSAYGLCANTSARGRRRCGVACVRECVGPFSAAGAVLRCAWRAGLRHDPSPIPHPALLPIPTPPNRVRVPVVWRQLLGLIFFNHLRSVMEEEELTVSNYPSASHLPPSLTRLVIGIWRHTDTPRPRRGGRARRGRQLCHAPKFFLRPPLRLETHPPPARLPSYCTFADAAAGCSVGQCIDTSPPTARPSAPCNPAAGFEHVGAMAARRRRCRLACPSAAAPAPLLTAL